MFSLKPSGKVPYLLLEQLRPVPENGERHLLVGWTKTRTERRNRRRVTSATVAGGEGNYIQWVQ